MTQPQEIVLPATAEDVADLEKRPYLPYGGCDQLMHCQAGEVVLSGPAGTGKSRGCLEKLHRVAGKWPGMRGLIVRKTRASLSETALVTFEDKVVHAGHPILEGASRAMRRAYSYPNGSEIVLGGMDKPTKVMSSEYDLIYVQEAIELTENDWESLTTRLRNGVVPYQQLLADTNPDTPMHWLKRRADAGQTRMIECRHEDNPVLWDRRKQQWTPAGVSYLAKLDALTGPRKLRLRSGKWVQAEGVVYEGWDRAVHIINPFEIPTEWQRFLVVDFGFTNPFVCQWWAVDPDGRMIRYRELYHTSILVEDAAKEILRLSENEPMPRALICDHDAEGRATLDRYLRMTSQPAKKEKTLGIQTVASRLKLAGDGKPRLFVFRDALVSRDPALVDSKRPCCLEEEIEGYIWDTNGKTIKDEPIKKNDHALDCMRYAVMHVDNPPPLCIIRTERDMPQAQREALQRRQQGQQERHEDDYPEYQPAMPRRRAPDGKGIIRGPGGQTLTNPYGHLGSGNLPL